MRLKPLVLFLTWSCVAEPKLLAAEEPSRTYASFPARSVVVVVGALYLIFCTVPFFARYHRLPSVGFTSMSVNWIVLVAKVLTALVDGSRYQMVLSLKSPKKYLPEYVEGNWVLLYHAAP